MPVKQRKHANPYDTICEVIPLIVEADYEDSDISQEEFELAQHRFRNALEYIITRKVEELLHYEKE